MLEGNGGGNGNVQPDVQIKQDGLQTPTTPDPVEPSPPKWVSQLPEELKGEKRLFGYESLGGALKELLDGKGQSMEDGDESVFDYELPKTITEQLDPSGLMDKSVALAVKEMKLNKKQAEVAYEVLSNTYKESTRHLKENGAKICEEQLKEMWGEDYDKKIAHMKRAYGLVVKEGSPLAKGLQETMAENNPFVVELIAAIGESISEHTPPTSKPAGEEVERRGFLTRENEKYPWQM